jgi:Reverse transcriptase (RNA-dependent DNA polymerase)./Integrase core domain.
MDDILIYSRTPEEHLEHIRFVLETLKQNVIYLNPKKCDFNKPEIRFLGHLVSRNGVRPDPAKVSVMKDWPEPKNKQDMYRFLGFANYFRQFIRNFATIASPLYPLTQCKTEADFTKEWKSLQRECFKAIKLALCHAPTLKMPDFDSPFEVIVDASNVAVGAVLTQNDRPVAYESKKLTPAEMRWTTTERELFAAVHALRQWSCYLRHPTHEFALWTDHNPNTFFSQGTGKPLTPRQARWQEFLAPFNFKWKYKKGLDNIADALSRPPDEDVADTALEVAVCFSILEEDTKSWAAEIKRQMKLDDEEVHWLTQNADVVKTLSTPKKRSTPTPTSSKPPKKQRTPTQVTFDVEPIPFSLEDEDILVTGDAFPDPPVRLTEFERELWGHRLHRFFRDQKRDWSQDTNGLWRDTHGRLILPPDPDLRKRVMQACHDSVFSGHLGKAKTLNLCTRLFHWPGINKDVENYVKSCRTCQSVKPHTRRPYGRIRPLQVPYGKWTDVTVDMVTDLPMTARGFDSVLVFVDRCTKMVHVVPTTKTLDAEGFVKLFVDTIIKHHGAPIRLVSDRGSNFAAKYTHCATYLMGVLQDHSTAYHPQTDGQTERMNRVMEDILRCYADAQQTAWDLQLPMVEFAINNSPAEATGQTPFVLNYGTHPRIPPYPSL